MSEERQPHGVEQQVVPFSAQPGGAVQNPVVIARRVRTALAATVLARALAWAIVVLATVLLGGAVTDALRALTLHTRELLRVIAIAAAISTLGAILIRDRPVWSLHRAALWLEEHTLALQYALVTGVETQLSGGRAAMLPEPRWKRVTAMSSARALLWPVLAVVSVSAAWLVVPPGAASRVATPRPGDSLERAALGGPGAADGRLSPLVAKVTPPRYSRLATVTIDEPARLTALVGSNLRLIGRGTTAGLEVMKGAEALPVSADDINWVSGTTMPARAVVLRLRDGAHERLVALEPIADLPPSITLVSPARDTVVRAAVGDLPLSAQATDDIGVSSARFEVIVSSGAGETFTFRSTILGAIRSTSRRATLRAVLSLDSLHLQPGDMVHVRAVAVDGNDLTGPGTAASETRVVRVARNDEGDSVAVEGAAPPEARAVVSQRMLILLAEALERERQSLSRQAVFAESGRISADQKQLRRSVGSIIFTRVGDASGEEIREESHGVGLTPAELLKRAEAATGRNAQEALDFEGGESPVVAINRPLLEAYNAMWAAGMELDQGEPGRALPHMRVALEAIQRARQAERVYLRGRPPAAVVDVPTARLSKVEPVDPRDRASRGEIAPELKERGARLQGALLLASSAPGAAADSLMVLRVEFLETLPDVAVQLDSAVIALRRGDVESGTAAGIRARRLLAGPPVTVDSLSAWRVAP